MFRRQDGAGDFPEYGGASPFLHEKVGPVPGEIGDFIGKVHIARLFKLLDLVFRGNLIEHGLETVVVEEIVLDPLDLAADADGGLLSRYQVQVRSALVVHQLEKRVYFSHGNPPRNLFLYCQEGNVRHVICGTANTRNAV